MSDGEFQIPDELRDFFDKQAEESKKIMETYGDQIKEIIGIKKESMTGIELITNERLEHKVKHGFSIRHDAENYKNGELAQAAAALLEDDMNMMPNWGKNIVEKMFSKPREGKLVIAGALIAAQIDVENYKKND